MKAGIVSSHSWTAMAGRGIISLGDQVLNSRQIHKESRVPTPKRKSYSYSSKKKKLAS